jgi:hypothetical protein
VITTVARTISRIENLNIIAFHFEVILSFLALNVNVRTTTFTFDVSGNQRIENTRGGITSHTRTYEKQRKGILQFSGSRETMTYNADLRQHWKE